MKEPLKVHVRQMFPQDHDRFAEIELSADGPWSKADIVDATRSRDLIAVVAEHGDTIVGHLLYRNRKDSIEVVRLVVDPAYRRRGVGSRLVDFLKRKAIKRCRSSVEAIVSEDRVPALRFFRAAGFLAQVPLLRGRFGDLDGIEMRHSPVELVVLVPASKKGISSPP